MPDIFDFADAFGPSKIVHLYEPSIGLKAVVAVDNVACGPSIGGIRMASDVSTAEAFRLARAMTLKNAAAGLPHGGGKSVIFADPKMPAAEKEILIRAFADAIRDLTDYIPGPDMGTDERCMAWIKDEMGRAVGLPPEIGGIPLDAIGATGFGLSICQVLVVPDFIANAGGVICAAVEYHGGTQTMAFQMIEEKIRTNTRLVLEEAVKTKTVPRQAAVALAERRIRTAMGYRRWSSPQASSDQPRKHV